MCKKLTFPRKKNTVPLIVFIVKIFYQQIIVRSLTFQFVLSATFEQLQLHSLPQNPSATATFKQAGVAVAVEVALSEDVKNQPESRATTATEDVLKTTQLQQIGLDETWNQERT